MDVIKRYRPISYLKTNTADVARQLNGETDSLIITQNGVPAFVCVSMQEYQQTRETNALLRILALGEREIQRGNTQSLASARAELDKSLFGDKE
ncbi:type II toxin-antitoxin system Phd/YefM family antitoxin [Pseudoduganella sp. LjRoot289]|uniref:type II toxin-antitoxin system Phd/YefM family antitoxin n=1 Tax=Pseudoduganella sp. LjRoot289 TaxID=3342314 RepID=UPI003ECCA62F